MKKDNLGDRMKKYYESKSQTHLIRRMPVIIRLDGKAFHTFTKGFEKPFDSVLTNAMQETMKYLCENIQGCVLGYTQSDEITLVLIDYQRLDTCAWLDYNIQKLCSITASMASFIFNRSFQHYVELSLLYDEIDTNLVTTYEKAIMKGAIFDARCFNIPKEEVTNCILWRQQDAIRNSISSLGQAYFSQKELHGLNSEQIKEKLLSVEQNWNNLPIYLQRGSCCRKVTDLGTKRTSWIIDKEIPIFTGEDRNYIEPLINFE